ncbi:Threonylcarbamoyladenosine tRNA methylthiotransferase MtaB [bioreactor metagenome]|uniref:Threonylcarbamoyladenosine tRNA methylthiotransferase MtaB n=1 Tax=bioreactor metagenome TaxID=1076179 RepID=A0A645CZD9_9ZZZZ
MHIFPYSIRPGTPAAELAQIPAAVKEKRAARAATVADEMRKEYLEGCAGQVYPVLFEQAKGTRFSGHAPNYTEVLVPGGEGLHNRVLRTRITGTEGFSLLGELEETP